MTLDSKKVTPNRCVGADALLQLLKNYARSHEIKAPITVGFIGYPNTGKSSVINSLKRKQAVGTANTPGFTTHLAKVRLDAHITLIDSPGVIFNENGIDNTNEMTMYNKHTMDDMLQLKQTMETRLVLRNALKLQVFCFFYFILFYFVSLFTIKQTKITKK